MAVQTYNKLKTFNLPQLEIEVATLSLPAHEPWHAGFERHATLPNRVEPFPEASRQVGKRRVKGEPTVIDTALKGEVRYTTRDPLTAQQIIDLEAKLDAHDHTVDTQEQQDIIEAAADLVSLRSKVAAGMTPPDRQLIAKLLLDEIDGRF